MHPLTSFICVIHKLTSKLVSGSSHHQFADDTVIVSLLCNDNPGHGPVLKRVHWYEASYQDNNVSETKEMAVDFRNHPRVSPTVVFNDQAEEYKYLGTVTDYKLSFEHHFGAMCKRSPPASVYFSISSAMLIMTGLLCEYFYSCFTESVLTFTVHS